MRQTLLFFLFVAGVPIICPAQFSNKGFSDTITCDNNPDTARCLGINNTVYLARFHSRGLVFQRKGEGGRFTGQEKIVNPLKNASRYTVEEITVKGSPQIACDRSKGPHRGRIFICWSDEKFGPLNKDVFLVYSDDQGENWTEPILVTYRPNHKEQFHPVLYVDADSGYVNILYFDRQNIPWGKYSDLYLAQSRNGGLKFELYKLNADKINIEPGFIFENCIRPIPGKPAFMAIWRSSEATAPVAKTAVLVNDSALDAYGAINSWPDLEWERSYKFSEKIKIEFEIKEECRITATITKPLDPAFEKFVVKEKKFKKGKGKLTIDTKKLDLKKGNYVLTLYYKGKNNFTWITEE